MPDTSHAILGYEHYHQMLADPVRMDGFREAIFATVKPEDIVVDLGSGTSILSFWALQAGAKKVYAIEKTEAIAALSKRTFQTNHAHMERVIQLG